MNREQTQNLMLFVLVVLVCGGGCMTMPYQQSDKLDLSWTGLDEQERQRLAGLADPAEDAPKPSAGMRGRLVVYAGVHKPYWHRLHLHNWPIAPSDDTIKRLESLDGIDSAGTLYIDWPEPEYVDDKLVYPKIDMQATLLEQARKARADLVLVYTSSHDAKAFDPTLYLAQVLLLGFAPTVVCGADAELEAVLIDAHSGYIYALGAGEGTGYDLTIGWAQSPGKFNAAEGAVKDALDDYVKNLEQAWPMMREAHD